MQKINSREYNQSKKKFSPSEVRTRDLLCVRQT
jgi:hypothetical protein